MDTKLLKYVRNKVGELGVVKIIESNLIAMYRKQYDMSAVFEEIRNRELVQYETTSNDIVVSEGMRWEKGDDRYYWTLYNFDRHSLPYITFHKYVRLRGDPIILLDAGREKRMKAREPFCYPLYHGRKISKTRAEEKRQLRIAERKRAEIEKDYYRRYAYERVPGKYMRKYKKE